MKKEQQERTEPGSARRWFSIAMAADYCACTVTYIENQLRDGNIPYRWVGNVRVLERTHLDELIESLPVEKGKCEVPDFMRNEKKSRRVAA